MVTSHNIINILVQLFSSFPTFLGIDECIRSGIDRRIQAQVNKQSSHNAVNMNNVITIEPDGTQSEQPRPSTVIEVKILSGFCHAIQLLTKRLKIICRLFPF